MAATGRFHSLSIVAVGAAVITLLCRATPGSAVALSNVPADLKGVLRATSGQIEVDRLVQSALFRSARAFSLPHYNYPVFQFIAAGSSLGDKAFSMEDVVLVPGTKGLVALGIDLLDKELAQPEGRIAVDTIIAHEFAHIYQAYAGLTEPLARFQKDSKAKELHADYMAGWFMRQSTTWNTEYLAIMLKALYERGDYLTGDPDHHGTPTERFNATIEGFLNGGNRTAAQAAVSGREFIAKLTPP